MTIHPLLAHRARSPFEVLVGAVAASALLAVLAGTASAGSLVADIDPTQSSVTGFGALTGRIQLELDEGPLAGPNRSFDVVGLNAQTGDLSLSLDPDLASPGLGVLRADGQFLIPALFLRIGDGVDFFDLTVIDVLGSFGDSASCGGAPCLETAFQIDTVGQGILDVSVVARVAEPGSLLVVALGGLLLLPLSKRRRSSQGAIR